MRRSTCNNLLGILLRGSHKDYKGMYHYWEWCQRNSVYKALDAIKAATQWLGTNAILPWDWSIATTWSYIFKSKEVHHGYARWGRAHARQVSWYSCRNWTQIGSTWRIKLRESKPLLETSWETHLTRPDLSCAVSLVSQFMQNPKVPHMNATLRILRYLRKDPDIGLVQKTNT